MHDGRSRISGLRQEGYVLIFVLGVVLVLSVMVLGMSSATRIDASTVAARKKLLESEYLLKGAVERVAWGLETGQFPAAWNVGSPTKAGFELELYLNRPLEMQLNGQRLQVRIEDATSLVDPNQLTKDMWVRLGLVLGLESQEAERLGEQVERTRVVQRAASFSTPFRGMGDFENLPGLTRARLYGSMGGRMPALVDLVMFGKTDNQLDVNTSPAILYKVVHNISDAQMNTLVSWRGQRRLTAVDEQRLLRLPSEPRKPTAPPGRLLRVTVSFVEAVASTQQMVAVIRLSPEAAKVKSQFLFFRS